MLITILVFLLMLGILVGVHEWGHFIAAKAVGITVHEFAFGFKPRLFSWKRGETTYAINLIPLGGYVRMEGEAGTSHKKGSFSEKSPLQRILVLVAGVAMNFILAWLLLTIAYGIGSQALSPTFANHPGVQTRDHISVGEVSAGSPAANAHLVVGDEFMAVNGTPIKNADDFIATIKDNAGKSVSITYLHDGQSTQITLIPRVSPPANQGALGVTLAIDSQTHTNWIVAPMAALRELGSEISLTWGGVINFVRELFVQHQVSQDVTGIVGVGAATGVVRRLGVGPFLQFMAIISTSVAMINLVPLLPLDGGHVLFALIEGAIRRPIKDGVRQWYATFGLVLLLVLVGIVTYHDVVTFGLIDRFTHLF